MVKSGMPDGIASIREVPAIAAASILSSEINPMSFSHMVAELAHYSCSATNRSPIESCLVPGMSAVSSAMIKNPFGSFLTLTILSPTTFSERIISSFCTRTDWYLAFLLVILQDRPLLLSGNAVGHRDSHVYSLFPSMQCHFMTAAEQIDG